VAIGCSLALAAIVDTVTHPHFESLFLAKLKGKINLYLSFRNFGTPKYPESRSYTRQTLYFFFTSEFCIMDYEFRITSEMM